MPPDMITVVLAHPYPDAHAHDRLALQLELREHGIAHDQHVGLAPFLQRLHQPPHGQEVDLHLVAAKARGERLDEGLYRASGQDADQRLPLRFAFSSSLRCASGGTASP